MVSCEDMQFYKDMDMFNGEDSTWPGVASLIKNEDGKIFRYAKSNFGPGDNYCIMWDFNDLLPVQDPVWAPEYQTVTKSDSQVKLGNRVILPAIRLNSLSIPLFFSDRFITFKTGKG